jgi:protein-tyrosine phosphatase
MSWAPEAGVSDVPDPYYGGPADFELALDLIERACDGLVAELKRRLG